MSFSLYLKEEVPSPGLLWKFIHILCFTLEERNLGPDLETRLSSWLHKFLGFDWYAVQLNSIFNKSPEVSVDVWEYQISHLFSDQNTSQSKGITEWL